MTCSCGYTITDAKASHTGGTATCTAKAKCEVCDTEYGEMLKHSYTVPKNDATHHWNKCTRCDETSETEKHSIDDGICTVCEYQPPKEGLSGGAIAAIVIASVSVLGGGGFALWWFVFRRKIL